MEERLQKILGRAGVASRRAAEALILDGRVRVNGRIVTELGTRADPERDTIAVDGEPVARAAAAYLMLHKPAGYVTTRHDPEGRPTVYDLVPDLPGLVSVGRLDRDTEGLLLLTTDGDWAERVAHPRYGVEREYEVTVRGAVSFDALARLREGIMLEGRPAKPLLVRVVGQEGVTSILAVVLREGRNREVRLLCVAAGLPVRMLVRRRVGSVHLGWLETGHWRHLSAAEVTALAGLGRREGWPARRAGERKSGSANAPTSYAHVPRSHE